MGVPLFVDNFFARRGNMGNWKNACKDKLSLYLEVTRAWYQQQQEPTIRGARNEAPGNLINQTL